MILHISRSKGHEKFPITHNTGHIHRQKVFNSSYSTVDGEGILVQCSNGNNQYRNIWDSNDLSGGSSGYIAYYNVAVVEDCDIINNKVNKDQIELDALEVNPTENSLVLGHINADLWN